MKALVKKAKETLLTADELAARWKVTEGHLRNMRYLRQGPPHVRVAGRGVRYRLSVVQEWEARR